VTNKYRRQNIVSFKMFRAKMAGTKHQRQNCTTPKLFWKRSTMAKDRRKIVWRRNGMGKTSLENNLATKHRWQKYLATKGFSLKWQRKSMFDQKAAAKLHGDETV